MDSAQNPEEFYENLKAKLQDTAMWPTEYLYKFIVVTKESKVEIIQQVFDNMGAVIQTTKSKKGKYTSVSVNVRMKDPDAVIDKYIEIGEKVDGVISL